MAAVILRDYQLRDVERLRLAYRAGARAVIYQAPTGSGKTVLFAHIVRSAVERGNSVWICVHRQELLAQCSRALWDLDIDHLIVSAGRHPPHAQVLVCSVQTLVRRVQSGQMGTCNLLVLDEAHHSPSTTWRTIIDAQPTARMLGVTATPMRLDGTGLRSVFDTLVVGPGVRELIDEGHLSDYTIYAPPSELDLSGVRRQAGDWAKGELAQRVDKPKITGNAVEHYERLCAGAPALVFCVSIAHAQHVADEFRTHGWRAESIDGTLDSRVRRQRIKDLGGGRLHVLTSCEIVSEGTDIPVVSAAILLRPTQSLGLYLQQVGRVLRPAPGKERALILDHVGNCMRHGFPDDERDWSLDGRIAPTSQPIEAIRTCGACFAAFRPAPYCPACGAEYIIQPREIPEEEGNLEEVRQDMMRRVKRHEVGRATTREALEAIARERGYNAGWVSYVLDARARNITNVPIDPYSNIKSWKGERSGATILP